MRQHKFRVWDYHRHRMIYGHNKDTPGPAWTFQMYEAYKGLMPDRFKLMEATDFIVNGTEAWEGDIVATPEGNGVIWYLPERACFAVFEPTKVICSLNCERVSHIVGNTFENPQALQCPVRRIASDYRRRESYRLH